MTFQSLNARLAAAAIAVAAPLSADAALQMDLINPAAPNFTQLPESAGPEALFCPGVFVFELDENGNAVCRLYKDFPGIDAPASGSPAAVPAPGAVMMAPLALLMLRRRRGRNQTHTM